MKSECVKRTHFKLGGGGTEPIGASSGIFWLIYKMFPIDFVMELLLSIGDILLEGCRTFRRYDIAETCKSLEGMLSEL